MPDQGRLAIEGCLETARRAVWAAMRLAESGTDEGLTDDLWSLGMEIGRVRLSLVPGSGSPKTSQHNRAQLRRTA